MSTPFSETADIETASEDYASRFASPAGQWMLQEQARHLLELTRDLPRSAKAIDVGGGHAQTAPLLADAGLSVHVTGSAAECSARLPEGMSFEVADNLHLPHENESVDLTLAFRYLPHCDDWPSLVRELCRLSRRFVLVDYPAKASVNVVADSLFALKKKVEKNTRPFTLFSHKEIIASFEANGFRARTLRKQFFWPMVIHRMLNKPGASRFLEAVPRYLGLTAIWGSPAILLAERVTEEAA